MKLRDQLTGLDVERRKQRRRPMPTLVVRGALDLPRTHRQHGSRPVQRLNLRFLVDAEHDRMRGGCARLKRTRSASASWAQSVENVWTSSFRSMNGICAAFFSSGSLTTIMAGLTPVWVPAFLEVLANIGSVSHEATGFQTAIASSRPQSSVACITNIVSNETRREVDQHICGAQLPANR
jgi:hypothetical protein